MADVAFRDVTKVFRDGTVAVSSFDLDVPDGALCVLVGPSASGKTTLLRLAAGLRSLRYRHGDVAQLEERLVCNQEVAGSNPVISTACRVPHSCKRMIRRS